MQFRTRMGSLANGCPGWISAPFVLGTMNGLHDWTGRPVLLSLLSLSGLVWLLLLLSPLKALPRPPAQAFPQHGQLPAGYKRQPDTASSSSPAFEGACGPSPPALGQRTFEGPHRAQFNSSLSNIIQHVRARLF